MRRFDPIWICGLSSPPTCRAKRCRRRGRRSSWLAQLSDGCTEPSRMPEGICSSRIRPGKSSPGVAIWTHWEYTGSSRPRWTNSVVGSDSEAAATPTCRPHVRAIAFTSAPWPLREAAAFLSCGFARLELLSDVEIRASGFSLYATAFSSRHCLRFRGRLGLRTARLRNGLGRFGPAGRTWAIDRPLSCRAA